ALIDDLMEARRGLVHGDFSPKNLLSWPGGLVLVDHETCHLGEPAFDVGFFFSHLFLKALRFPGMLPLIEAARQGYGEGEAFRRGLPHLGACLLARIDGTSPVDYLEEEGQKEAAREMGRALLAGGPWESLPVFPRIRP
ncbi:MAG: phosphotransferase, partial [Gemmataceae bacterium]|nr:phosphotransferase [Gemmataceae bacterium]